MLDAGASVRDARDQAVRAGAIRRQPAGTALRIGALQQGPLADQVSRGVADGELQARCAHSARQTMRLVDVPEVQRAIGSCADRLCRSALNAACDARSERQRDSFAALRSLARRGVWLVVVVVVGRLALVAVGVEQRCHVSIGDAVQDDAADSCGARRIGAVVGALADALARLVARSTAVAASLATRRAFFAFGSSLRSRRSAHTARAAQRSVAQAYKDYSDGALAPLMSPRSARKAVAVAAAAVGAATVGTIATASSANEQRATSTRAMSPRTSTPISQVMRAASRSMALIAWRAVVAVWRARQTSRADAGERDV